MNELKIFENPEFGEIRTVSINNEPWFVGKDVAAALGYSKAQNAISAHVDLEDKQVAPIQGTLGGTQDMTIINESGLYSLVLSSKLPDAKKFKRWITSEVLPSLRKSGGYVVGQAQMSDEELMAKALIAAQRTISERNAQISQLTVENAIMSPKAEYFDELVDRNLLTNFRDTAKALGIKPKAFVRWLSEKKYIFHDKAGKIQPYADKVESGLFEVKESCNDKTQWAGTQTLITPKGRETFRLLCQGL